MALQNRCLNCFISFNNPRIVSREVLQLSTSLRELLMSWNSLFEISEEHRVCEECFNILHIDEPTRRFGHRSICLGCGVSVLRARSIGIDRNRPEYDIIRNWVPQIQDDFERQPIQVNVEIQAGEDAILPPIPPPLPIEDHFLPPNPPPLPIPEPVQDVHPQRQTMSLPNYKRVSATSRRCLNSDCLNVHWVFLLIPMFIRVRMIIDFKIYIPRCARVCSDHLFINNDWDNLVDEHLIDTFSSEQIEDMLYLLGTQQSSQFDFENIENMNDYMRQYWIGVTVQQFYDIINGAAILVERLKGYKTALAMYLSKLRTGDSDARLSTIFGVSKSTFQRKCTIVREYLYQYYVPNHLGLRHMTVQDATEHNLTIPSELFGRHLTRTREIPLIIICDGTYIYTQKSSNYRFQKNTYSLHKYQNLVKPFMLVCSDGYILDILGPYSAKESDALIMKNAFINDDGPMRSYFRNGDVFIVDRGFRDVVPELQNYGYNVHMPESVEEGNFQLSTFQANRTRLVTLVRWVVEVVNGRFKRDFKLLRQDFYNWAAPHVMIDFSIGGALINHFHPLLTDRPDALLIAIRALNRLNEPNYLGEMVNQQNMNRQRIQFNNISAHLPHLVTFPQLTMSQLELIALGTYQIKQARSYYGEHVREGGIFRIEVNSQLEVPDNEHIFGTLIRGRISSRHSSKVYYTYVTYNPHSEHTNEDSITGYYCNCKAGSRTVGCCSHVMVIIWFLSWARYNPDNLNPPAAFLDHLLIVEDE